MSLVTVGGATLSRAELDRAAGAVARDLAALGAVGEPSETGTGRVAVWARPTLETVVAVAGALAAGVEVVPVPPDSGVGELRHLLGDAAPSRWLGPAPEGTGLPVLDVDTTAAAAWEPLQVGPEHVDLLLYTSGTTGLPKGVPLRRRAIDACLDGLARAWDWTTADVLAHGLPLFHVHGLVLGVLGPLRVGSGLVHVGRPTPASYAAARRTHGATVLFGVPTIWSRIAEQPEHAAALREARLLVSGSAALPVPVWERLRALTGHEVVERYGMTETLITVATRATGPVRAGWVGRPLDGVETRVVDDVGRPVPADGESVGHLQVRGPTVFDGYLGRPEATAESFTADGWFRTGDVAVLDAEGAHRIVGRASVDLIKSGGWRIGAGEVESTLLGHPAVAECAVVGVPDDDLGQRVVAHVVPRPGRTASAELADELVDHVGRELSAHKRPREVVWAASLPRNEMGKVQKSQLGGTGTPGCTNTP